MRQMAPKDYTKLKAWTRRLIAKCGGGVESAKVTRVNDRTLSSYGSADLLDCFMPLDVAMDLEAECGEPVVSRGLIELSRETAIPASPIEPFKFLAHLSQEVGSINGATIECAADGHWTPREYDRWIEEANGIRDMMTNAIDAMEGAKAASRLQAVGE